MSADLFDDYPQTSDMTNNYVQQVNPTNNYEMFDDFSGNNDNTNKQSNQGYLHTQEGFGQQPTNGYGDTAQSATRNLNTDIFVSPEQLIRREKLRQIEEERIKQVHEKDESERTEKQDKQRKAQQYLSEWKQQRSNELSQRLKQNKANQALLLEARKNQNEYKNPWDKVGSNISLKDGEYPGKKDVGKMKQAILNKKSDLNR